MRIQHKKLIICILYVVVLFVVVFFNDTIGHIVSGSAVNFIIAVATGGLGMFYGLAVAIAAPIAVLLIDQVYILPFFVAMCFGNIMYVLVLHISPGVIEHSITPFLYLTPMIGAALVKYYVQLFTAVEIAPAIFNLGDVPQQLCTQLFGSNQLISALIGSILGITTVKLYDNLLGKDNEV